MSIASTNAFLLRSSPHKSRCLRSCEAQPWHLAVLTLDSLKQFQERRCGPRLGIAVDPVYFRRLGDSLSLCTYVHVVTRMFRNGERRAEYPAPSSPAA